MSCNIGAAPFFQCRDQVDPGSDHSGSDAEKHSGNQRHQEGKAQHRQIYSGVRRTGNAVTDQPKCRRRAQVGKGASRQAAGDSQQQTLGKQLAHDSCTTRA